PGATLLVVSFDPVNNPGALTAFRSYYNLDDSTPLAGPYSGKLANDNDQIELRKPGVPDTNGVDYILVEKVKYFDTAPWPALAGTDPRNPQSVLRLETVRLAVNGTNMLLTFTAVSNHSYSVQWKESPGAGSWTKLADVNADTNTRPVNILDPLPLARGRLYRL